ncbi:MAG: tRNA pseudouridine(55) synthase TruB [Clostridium sp.]|nr:tRNA pseudouridine(55) synthase TruB [Clostridium sp.]
MVRPLLRHCRNLVPGMVMREGPLDFLAGETIYIDKPLRWTSFDVVKRLRSTLLRRLNIRKLKVGHAGTLDPLATGVMIVVTGRSTKLIEQLQSGEKEYVATVRFGATTPSFDLETEIDATFPAAHLTAADIEAILPRFTGRVMQVPPAFSACKIDGHRAYRTARKGGTVELKAKPLEIREIELLGFIPGQQPEATLRVVCGKGTYIRALARDLGEALDNGAHLTALRRTRVGDVSIDDCVTVDTAVALLQQAEIAPVPEELLKNKPKEKEETKTNHPLTEI